MSTIQQAKAFAALLNVPADTPDGDYGSYVVETGDFDERFARAYVGSVFALDPCGRYHHMLQHSAVPQRCTRYWASLERQLERRGVSLESGDGDPTDIFVSKPLS